MSSESRRLQRYLSVETAGGGSWHPSGKKIAFAYDGPGLYQIFAADIHPEKTLWPTRLTFEDDRCTNPMFLKDGSLVFTRDFGGDENFQIGLITKGHELVWLTSDKKAKHLLDMTTEHSFYFIGNIEDKARLDLYRHQLPVADNESEVIYRPKKGIASVQAVSEDESKLIVQRYLGSNQQDLLLVESDDGSVINLTRAVSGMVKTRWQCLRFVDDEHLLVATDFGSDFKRLGLLSVTTDYIPLLDTELPMEFGSSSYSTDSEYTYLSYNEDGYSVIYRGIFSKNGVENFERVDLPIKGVLTTGDSRSFVNGMSLSPGGNQLAITLSSATSALNVWILDTENGTAWKATSSGISGLSPDSFSDASLHHFGSFDILQVPYFKFTPKGQMPAAGWPGILMIHGGPEAQLRPTFNPVIQFMVSAGFAVVAPNIRGSTGYGRRYMDLDNVEKRLDSIMDIRYLAHHLKDNDPEIDGDRLVIYGGSYGGFAVLSAMTEHPDLWKAGVDIVGISNFVTFLENTAPWRRKLREVEYGSLDDDREMLERISPIHKVDRIVSPLFIIQGDNDERVPLSESLQIHDVLKDKGLDVRLMRFADEGHGIAKLTNKIKAYTEVLDWLKQIV